MNDQRVNFLIASINDIHSTIRAIDAKSGVVVAFLVFPLSNVDKVHAYIGDIIAANMHSVNNLLVFVLISIFILSWLFSLLIISKAISALDNPSKHIQGWEPGEDSLKGAFYVGGAFRLRFRDTIFNLSAVKSQYPLDSYLSMLPTSYEDIIKELTFEQLQLAYIRDIKMHRFNTSLRLAYIWLLSGAVMYIVANLIATKP